MSEEYDITEKDRELVMMVIEFEMTHNRSLTDKQREVFNDLLRRHPHLRLARALMLEGLAPTSLAGYVTTHITYKLKTKKKVKKGLGFKNLVKIEGR